MNNIKKRMLMYKKLLIMSLMSSTLALTGCNSNNNEVPLTNVAEDFTYEDTDVESINVIKSDLENTKYDYNVILSAIDSNSNLNDMEKEFLKNLKFVFDENYKYMALGLIESRIENLKINYNEFSNDSIGGKYDGAANEINMYECKNFEDCNKCDLLHEIMHIFQFETDYGMTSELSNEFFSREVMRRLYENNIISEEELLNNTNSEFLKFGRGYEKYINIYYLIAELVDEETLRKYQFVPDNKVIIDGICDNCNNILECENAERVISLLDSHNINNEKDLEECLEYLNYYFVEKKGYEINENINYLLLLSNKKTGSIPYCSDEEYKILEDIIVENTVIEQPEKNPCCVIIRNYIPKTYLSDSHKNSILTYSGPSLTDIEITDKIVLDYTNKLKEKNKVKTYN